MATDSQMAKTATILEHPVTYYLVKTKTRLLASTRWNTMRAAC